jgi:MazG family protein
MTHKIPRKSIDTLLEIMHDLRAPDGCPWDAEQTPESLAPYILEEACELIDAIEEGDPELILDELGDLLLQVVFQAQIFTERRLFDFYDVSTCIAEKLLRRHPHVFAREIQHASATELDTQWEKIKSSETTHNKSCLADHLPNKLPALQRAQKLIARTYNAERHRELPDGNEIPGQPHWFAENEKDFVLDEESLGRLLLQVVRMSHDAGLDAETALRKTTRTLLHKLDGG